MSKRACLMVTIAVAVLNAGCAARTIQRNYVRIAEGLTAPTLGEAMRVAPRMFAARELSTACQDPRSVARLQAPSARLELQVGERLVLSTLNIVAVNSANVAMAAVPVTIEATESTPPVLQLRSDDPDLNEGRLYPLNPGTFRLRVRTICSGPGAEMTIRGTVAP